MKNQYTVKFFNKLPFFCELKESPNQKDSTPIFLPFSLGYSKDSSLVKQVFNKEVDNYLRTAYKKTNLYNVAIDESFLGKKRGDEFLKVLNDNTSIKIKYSDILEIGCSTGYILNQLELCGAQVEGCEPGHTAKTAVEKYGLKVKNAFFDPYYYNKKKFDLVINLTVLEHISNLDLFLNSIISILKENGNFFIGVPDSSEQLSLGDPALMDHAHWSYFTDKSLEEVLDRVGFTEIQTKSTKSGALYAWGKYNGKKEKEHKRFDYNYGKVAERFVKNLNRNIDIIENYVNDAMKKKEKIGLYGASTGAANLWSLINWGGVEVELFDGDIAKKGKYLPGCPLKIKSSFEIINSDVKKIIILPISFADEIKTHLINDLNISDKIIIDTLKSIIDKLS